VWSPDLSLAQKHSCDFLKPFYILRVFYPTLLFFTCNLIAVTSCDKRLELRQLVNLYTDQFSMKAVYPVDVKNLLIIVHNSANTYL